MNVKIIVATHKIYPLPEDEMYLPVFAGAALQNGNTIPYTSDSTGKNISEKNVSFCELTALYWAWKNCKADYIGLCHYRRFFSRNLCSLVKRKVLSTVDAEKLLTLYDVLLPLPRYYFIETNYSQYAHAHHAVDLNLTREIISEKYPDYLKTYDAYMNMRKGHRFNMFVMKASLLDSYCSWLFDILFELEFRLDISAYSENDKRVFGFVAERLLDVWLIHNEIQYRDVPCLFLESQHWCKKIVNFCFRKVKAEKRCR